MPPILMDIILYAQTGCAITSCTKINDGRNFELNTQNFLPPIVTDFLRQFGARFRDAIAVPEKFSNNSECIVIVILITFYSPSCLGQETAKGPFGLRVKLPPTHLSTTHDGCFTLSL